MALPRSVPRDLILLVCLAASHGVDVGDVDHARPRAELLAGLRGAGVLSEHFGCDLTDFIDGETADLAASGADIYLAAPEAAGHCQPPVDSWVALLEAERAGLHLVQTATVPPFLMFTLDPRVDAGMSMWLHRFGMLEPYKQEWLRQAGVEEARTRGEPPLFVDVGAALGFFGLFAMALGWRAHFVEPSFEHIVRLSLRVNGWAPRRGLWHITPVLEPTSLFDLLEGSGRVAALKVDLDQTADTAALLGAGRLFRGARVQRLVASLWTGSLVAATIEMLQAAGCAVERVVDTHDEQWARLMDGEQAFPTEPVGDALAFADWLAEQELPMREVSATLQPQEGIGHQRACDEDVLGEQFPAIAVAGAEGTTEDVSWLDDV